MMLNQLIKFEQGIFSIPNDLCTKNKDEIYLIVKSITKILKDLSKLSDKGYINNPNIDLPILHWLFSEYKIRKITPNTSFSIQLNTLYLNLVLLLLFNIILTLEKHSVCSDENCIDLKTDIITLHKSILRMINPKLRDKINNKGLSVLLNTTVGFDSEYELDSSMNMSNSLLSIQLAGNTGLVLKVPIVDKNPVKPTDINGITKGGENYYRHICCKSLDNIISNIRNMLYRDNDILLDNLLDKLIKMDIKHEIVGDYKVFIFPKTEVKTCIKYLDEYKSSDLIKDSDNLNNDDLYNSLQNIFGILNDVCNNKDMSDKLNTSIKNSSNKPSSRITYRNGTTRLSITINRVLTICMHESSADLSMLKDFDVFKDNLDIVARSFVTLGKPLVLNESKSKVHFRDTVLIAPMGAKSLAGVGSIYGNEFKKLDIGDYRGNMRKLLKENKELFEEYAIRDSLITLKHANSMEEFNFTVGKIGVPLTISGIGKSYVLKEWSKMNYKGYQVSEDVIIGNLSNILTPKGARSVGITNFIVPFIAGYRGGRNESYMYGIDEINSNERSWIDYDLTSCYTTVMSILGHPDIDNAVRLYNKTVQNMNNLDLLYNYIIVDVDFKFPNSVKYPCIPTRVDDNIDIYPREGRSTITGSEYLVAQSMGCRLFVRSGVMVPFKRDNKSKTKSDYFGPFRSIVKELQRKRRLYPKKTFYNYMFKEIGNSVYGQVSMGISGKKTFDVKTKSHIKVEGGLLSNPILASYITGFTRALIGECLHNIQQLKGSVVSTTTDGFITNITDLENKILNLNSNNKNCLSLYRETRRFLTTFDDSEADDSALEIKNIESTGLISCKTRVQLGFTDGGILAATGFQSRNLEKSFLINEFSRILNSDSKTIEYVQTGLRSANDIYKRGGHVIAKYKDRSFSLEYDNKRRIVENKNNLLDSEPWQSIGEYGKIRILKETVTKPVFTKGYVESQSKGYKSYIETSVRGFVKACLSDDDNKRFGIPNNAFNSYKSIIDFVAKHELAKEVKLSLSSMSKLKHRNVISRTVPRTVENESFIKYVKENFVSFDDERFFKELSTETIRSTKKR